MRTLLIAAVAATAAALPVPASATPAPVTGSDIITTCGQGYSGYIRRFGKDALCLQPGTRTWAGFKAFECKGAITVYFKNGTKLECGGGIDFPDNGGIVKTVAR
ncbi:MULTISPECIES: hypothetical protein [Amycolatopsis]|uniref:Uncharacterized protein n=1 Tax=Amycolatopsis tucumanensis TaxID=401106 RepID=A0ABP7IC45_9PSEU|nr:MULTISPECIES: hypothetical protein [Amycolatopsis]MCF6422600.1 hypothetical protein [Amycolatopsis tucumanensis]